MIPVMLVEDEFLVRVGLKTCIPWEELGYQIVAEADSAEVAARKYAECAPSLIVTDIRLPHKSGIDLMHEIRSRDKAVRFIIISAFDDFTIAQQAIEVGVDGYFIKGNLDTDKLTRLLDELRRDRFAGADRQTSVPRGRRTMPEVYRDWLTLREDERLAALKAARQPLFLALLQAPGASMGEFTEMVGSYLSGLNIRHEILEDQERVWFFLTTEVSRLMAAMEKLVQMSTRYLNSGLRIGVSADYFLREDLETTVLEALLAAGHVAEPGGVEYYCERANSRVKSTLRQFEELLQLGCNQEAAALLTGLRLSLVENYSVQGFLGAVYGLIGILTVRGANPAAFRSILECLDVEEVFAYLQQQTVGLAQERDVAARDNVYVRKAKNYIHSHIAQKLNIQSIAQAIHVSSNYLGRIFFNETGEYLTDYINRSKMEYAKELLVERQHSMMEIAGLVGIPDQRYFSKLFKKYSGVTPTEFANQFSPHGEAQPMDGEGTSHR